VTAHPEGRLRIALSATRGGAPVQIESTRPVALANRFAGRHPKEVKALVPLVYSICRAAQTAACEEAFEKALPGTAHSRRAAIRKMLTLSETAREHGLQVLHAWPRCFAVPEPALASSSIKKLLKIDLALNQNLHAALQGDPSGLDAARKTIADLEAALGEAIFGEVPSEWQARPGFNGLSFWASRNETPAQTAVEYVMQAGFADAGAVDIDPLPELKREELETKLFGEGAEHYIAQPTWNGRPRETTPLARQWTGSLIQAVVERAGAGLLARLAACLAELASIPAELKALVSGLPSPGEAPAGEALNATGTGVGVAEAARGRLIHGVEIEDGLIRLYRILAPTEWNFHPEGAAARGLAQIARLPDPYRERIARLFITAVDPCVGYELRLS